MSTTKIEVTIPTSIYSQVLALKDQANKNLKDKNEYLTEDEIFVILLAQGIKIAKGGKKLNI